MTKTTQDANGTQDQSQRLLRVFLVRHGETDHNVAGIIQGQLDTPLNALGRIQASLVGRALGVESIDEIYSSPLERAADTAQAIYDSQPTSSRPNLYHDNRLKERAFGSLEGARFKGEKTDAIEGIEKSADLAFRVASFWNELIDNVQRGQQLGQHGAHATVNLVKPSTDSDGAVDKQPTAYHKTIALVGHGAALSSLLNVLSSYAGLAQGVKASRLWNCSITEVLVGLDEESEWEDIPTTPAATTASWKNWKVKPPHLIGDPTQQRTDIYPILITRWADTRHLAGDEAAPVNKTANADEIVVEEKDEKKGL